MVQLGCLASAQFSGLVFGLPGHPELPTSIPDTLQVESVHVAGDLDREVTNSLCPQGGAADLELG